MSAQQEWSSPPVDDNGYIPARQLLGMPDDELKGLIAVMRKARYEGWRNHEGRWRDLMGLDEGGREVLDFGCGTGMEALELARAGNLVTIADIVPANVHVAERVLRLHGYRAHYVFNLMPHWPYVPVYEAPFDTFHASGVLHHIPHARSIMERAHQLLVPGGDARLMLYSDQGWRIATGSEPPPDVTAHPDFMKFVRFFDSVGSYADWYSADKLQELYGDLFTLERCEYMTPDYRYLGAVLRKK